MLSKLKSEFLEELELNMSENTLAAYKYDIGRFLEYVELVNVKKPTRLKTTHITGFLSLQKEKGKASATLHRYYMSIKAFFTWMHKRNYTEGNITSDLSAPKYKNKPRKVPTQEQVLAILRQPDTSTDVGLRDKAILEVLYSSGLRASELCDLELGDFSGSQITVQCGKRDKTRTVPLTAEAVRCIEAYLEHHRGMCEGYLFQSFTGCRIRRLDLAKFVGRYAKRAGVKGVTPHTLRHACATHLLEHGADIRLIQKVLGHESIATTQIYAHMTSQSIQSAFHKHHPRGFNGS